MITVPFEIVQFGYEPPFKVNDIIISDSDAKHCLITKVYKYTWWRKLLYKVFGITYKYRNCIRIVKVDKKPTDIGSI